MSGCVWLLRHGDTEWTEEERHTGRRDVPLSEAGRQQARAAGARLQTAGITVAHVLVSPQRRARETCELAGYGAQATQHQDLVEWDYGELEGLTDEQTLERAPGWDLFRDGAPGGESPEDVRRRVERVIQHVRGLSGDCLIVAHGKLLRALAARWIEADVALGATLPLDPAAVALLEHEDGQPLLRLWNHTGRP